MIDQKTRLYECYVKLIKSNLPNKSITNSSIIYNPIGAELLDYKLYNSLIVKHSKPLLSELIR